MTEKSLNKRDTVVSNMSEKEHIVIHLHPETLKKVKKLVEKHHYENVEDFIITLIARALRDER
jgi:hypothetical protein